MIIHSGFWWNQSQLSWDTALKTITRLWKKLLCRYAVTKISIWKEPETKLLRQNLQTWPDEIKKSCPCLPQVCSSQLFWKWSSCWWERKICRVCATSLCHLSVVAAVDHFLADLVRLSVLSFLSIIHLLFYWFFQERKGDLLWLNCITRGLMLFPWFSLTFLISPWISY